MADNTTQRIYQAIIAFLSTIPLILITITVLIVSNDFANGIVSGKYFWFYLSMGLVAVSSVVIAIVKKGIVSATVIDFLVLALILTSSIFILYSYDGVFTTKYALLLLIITLYYYFRFTFEMNKSIVLWLTVCFVFTGFIEVLWGLRQLYGFNMSQHNLFRVTGSFFNPGPYACYIAVIVPMAFYYALKYRICYKVHFHIRNRPIYLIWGVSVLTIISSVLILPAAMSRAAWIACIGGCSLVSLHFIIRSMVVKAFIASNRKICTIAASFIILIIIAGGIGMYKIKKDSADGRMLIWKNTIELIKQNPMGVGIGNFSGSYGHIQAAYFESGKGTEGEKRVAGNPEYAFNEYLQICAEQGVIVFLLFIAIVGYSLYNGIRRKKIAATSSLLALLIVAGASYPFSVLPFLIVFVFLLALIHNGEKGIAISKPVSVIFAFCGLIIVSLCLYNRYPTYDAYKKWNKVKILYNFGSHKNAVSEYQEIYPLLSDQIQFLFEYAQCLSKSEQYKESNEVLEKAVKISCDPMLYNVMGKNFHALRQYSEAEQCFIKSSNIVPNRIYPHYLLALMYIDIGEMEKAQEAAQVVLTKEPKVQSTAVREMRNEMKKLLTKHDTE